jgi:endonuclease/exonuclease/phosphatase (EEP) superfamily protein YafD
MEQPGYQVVAGRRTGCGCYKGRLMRVWTGVTRACAGLVAGVVAVIGAATLLGLLDRYAWWFELADVFRVQYLVLLVAAGLAAVALRRIRLAGLAAVLAAINVAALGVPFGASATAAPGGAKASLRLVVANVQVGNTDYAAVERLVAETRPDLFGVIELTPEMAAQLRHGLPGYRLRVLSVRDDAYGIGLFSRVPLVSARVVRLPADVGPPTVVARVRSAGRVATVVVTHVHTPFAGSIHVRQLHALAAARAGWGERVAICGDFNTPPWSGPLRQLASAAGLRDLYAEGAWRGYSWPTWNWALRVPLDNCLFGRGVATVGHHDGPDVGSDHFPLVVDLRF